MRRSWLCFSAGYAEVTKRFTHLFHRQHKVTQSSKSGKKLNCSLQVKREANKKWHLPPSLSFLRAFSLWKKEISSNVRIELFWYLIVDILITEIKYICKPSNHIVIYSPLNVQKHLGTYCASIHS